MIKKVACSVFTLLLLAGATIVLEAQNSARPAHKDSHTSQQANDAERTQGEQRFQQNCGRCHQAPQTLSSRVAPTVLMHMRIRATLTAEDQRLILKFMNQ